MESRVNHSLAAAPPSGAVMMAMSFYLVEAINQGLNVERVALLLGTQNSQCARLEPGVGLVG